MLIIFLVVNLSQAIIMFINRDQETMGFFALCFEGEVG